MVENESQQLDLIFHALADGTRRQLLKMLAQREFTIGELAEPFQISLNAVSKHIKVLEEAGLLTRTKDGRIHRCAMNAAPLAAAQDVIRYYQQFWESRFRALDQYLQQSVQEVKVEGKKNGDRKE
jgi:DNA-binding transcriptional ArsR family regulator